MARFRIALIVPEDRGSWERARMASLAGAITRGGRAAGHDTEVVIASIGTSIGFVEEHPWPPIDAVRTREYQWRLLDPGESRRAVLYAGTGACDARNHIVPDDGIRQFLDCDLWVVASPRISAPLVPVRPVLLLLDDCLHHAAGGVDHDQLQAVADAVKASSGVLVTSEWMRREAVDFYGVEPARASLIPRIVRPEAAGSGRPRPVRPDGHFAWFLDEHGFGNLEEACRSLEHLVRRTNGRMACRIIPLVVHAADGSPRLPEGVAALVRDTDRLRDRVQVAAPADSDEALERELDEATFVWHPAPADDGRLIAARAAARGLHCLSADTPPMRELDRALGLGLSWMEGDDPIGMAASLGRMEARAARGEHEVPTMRHTPDDALVWAGMAVHL